MRTLCLLFCSVFVLSAQTPVETKEAPKPVEPQTAAFAIQASFATLAQDLYPTVVTITAYERDPKAVLEAEAGPSDTSWVKSAFSEEYPGFRKIGIASGVVVSEEGEILTCHTVLQKKDGTLCDLVDIETIDQRNSLGRIRAVEPTLNLALVDFAIKTDLNPPEFKVAKWGDSGAALPGHLVLGVGDPFGPERYFGFGLVTSPPNRDCYQEMLTSTYMQASMIAHPEAYGGGMFDLKGELIGILMPREPNRGTVESKPTLGVEFALPSNIAQGLFRALRTKQSFKSPWLGFSVMSRVELRAEKGPEAFNAMPKPRFGIFIENVFRPSPAFAAEIQPGDWLVSFNGEIIHTPIMFQRALYLAGIGADIELEMVRGEETRKIKLKIEERPANATTR